MNIKFAVPCLLGLEAPIANELRDMGALDVVSENGRVLFSGDEHILARVNIRSRFSERIQVFVGTFEAHSFEDLFLGTKAMPWERWIGKTDRFPVKGYSLNSDLFSVSDCQKIIKKAMVERMKQKYHREHFEEDGVSYPVRVSLMKDIVTVGIDTTGVSLHKRGYRKLQSKAPISETLAAALIMLTPWKKDRILVDPFCGSGTFPIEAAMMACNIAPGMNRSFLAEDWTNLIPRKHWYNALEEAQDLVHMEESLDLQGYDIDPEVVKNARENAAAAGVDHLIHFQQREVEKLRHPKKYGFIITNPPYGERLEEKEMLPGLYRQIGEVYEKLDAWSMYLITSYQDAERYIGRKADKNRKIYNGMIRTYYYQFLGPKPPKRREGETR